jgi:5-methylcytosine-specific restriction endonuclease McrA
MEKYYTGEVGVFSEAYIKLKFERTPKLYTIDYVLSLVDAEMRVKILIDDYTFKTNSQRYFVFNNSTECCCCGIKGKYFALEKSDIKHVIWHFNLYGIDDNGYEVLMTKDHIVPKSKGGRDILDNYRTMCSDCNNTRKNDEELTFEQIIEIKNNMGSL